MRLKVQPGVIGVAIRPLISGAARSLEEIIYETGQAALADAGRRQGRAQRIEHGLFGNQDHLRRQGVEAQRRREVAQDNDGIGLRTGHAH